MKKILLLLISIYSFSFSWEYTTFSDWNNRKSNQLCTASFTKGSTGSYTSSTSYMYEPYNYREYYKQIISGSSDGVGSYTVITYNCTNPSEDGVTCKNQLFDGSIMLCSNPNDSDPQLIDNPSNGFYDESGNLSCNSGFSAVGGSQCFENPENGYYDPFGEKQCNEGFYPTGSSTLTNACMNTPYTPEDNDGSCPSGWTTTTNFQTGQTTCLPPNYSNPDSGGDSGSGSTGGDSGSGSTGGDSGSGSTGGDSGSGSTGGSGSGSTGGTGGDTENVDNVSTAAYTCNDGGKSITTSSGLQSCDRTCEEVGLITDSDSNCKTSSTCPEGQYQVGINYLTNTPICYDLTATDTNNKLLAKIVDNTSLNKNSNTQLGSINTNINKSNVYLKNIDTNLSNINDDTFKDNTTSTSLKTEAESNKSLLTDIQTAYTNVTTAFSTLQTNYNDFKSFIDGKKLENNTINISSITLAKNNITVFGKTQRMDCFFNQDLNALFAPISPFITFFLNISFVYLSIKLFMNYALANRGGIV